MGECLSPFVSHCLGELDTVFSTFSPSMLLRKNLSFYETHTKINELSAHSYPKLYFRLCCMRKLCVRWVCEKFQLNIDIGTEKKRLQFLIKY